MLALVAIGVDGDVEAGGSVAGFAADIDFREGGGVALVIFVIAFDEVGAMTIGAHGVPALGGAGPVERVVGEDAVVDIGWIEMKPLVEGGIPAPAEDLESAEFLLGVIGIAVEFDHVLLEGFDAKDVLNGEVGELSVGALGMDEVAIIAAEEAGGDAEVFDLDILEIGEDGLRSGVVHR